MMTDELLELPFRRVGPHDMELPSRGSDDAAGFDLRTLFGLRIHPSARVMVSTGFATAIPGMFYGQIAPRSGLAVKHGIATMAGIIDSDYRGELRVVLINLGSKVFVAEPGERIAQLLLIPCGSVHYSAAEVQNLDDTRRGLGGFGSTGAA